jgi:hypothetical protein
VNRGKSVQVHATMGNKNLESWRVYPIGFDILNLIGQINNVDAT